MRSLHEGRAGALRAYGAASLAVACGYVAMHLLRARPVFPLDDPYIALHAAQVLHWGRDPNFPGVPALYGVTSAPFLALVYLLLFALPPLLALDMACWLGVLAYVLGLVRLSRQFGLARSEGVSLIVLGLVASFVPFHLINGLETSWAFAAVTWTLALGSGDRRNWKWSALLAGVTASIRPDLLPFAVLVAAALTYKVYRAEVSARRAVAWGAMFVALALLPGVPWMLWYWHATGVPYPLTGVAKRYCLATAKELWTNKAGIEGLIWVVYLISCGPLVVALVRAARRPMTKAVLAFVAVFLVAVYVQFPPALIWNWFRYPIVLTPMMVWAMAVGMKQADVELRRRAARLLRVGLIYSLVLCPVSIYTYLHECRYYDGGLHDLVAWCRQNLPSDARVMVHDAGYMAYATDYRLIDLVGLKTPEAIPLHRRYTWPTAGADRAKAVAALALETQAEYLVIVRNWEIMVRLPDDLRSLGWRVDPLRTDGAYRVYRLTAPMK